MRRARCAPFARISTAWTPRSFSLATTRWRLILRIYVCVRTCTRVATNTMVCAACPKVVYVGTSSASSPARGLVPRLLRATNILDTYAGLQITDSHSTVYGLRTVRGILHDLIHDSGRIVFSRTPPSAPVVFVLQRSTAHAPTRLPSLISIQLYARARWSVRCGTAGTQRGRASGRGLRTDTTWVRPQYDPALRTRQSSHPTADRNWAELGHDECPPPPSGFKCRTIHTVRLPARIIRAPVSPSACFFVTAGAAARRRSDETKSPERLDLTGCVAAARAAAVCAVHGKC